MRRLLCAVLVGLATSTLLVGAAEADSRPVGGCSRGGYELTSIAVLQELAQQTPDAFFTDADKNGDGYLCNKFLPEPSANVGIIHDNHVAGS